MPLPKPQMLAVAAKFGAAGIVNTLLTLAVYQVALFALSPSPSYAIAWLLGLVFVAAVYPARVFGVKQSLKNSAAAAGTYLVSFVAGLSVVNLGASFGHERLAAFIAIATTTALNFFLSRAVLARLSRSQADGL